MLSEHLEAFDKTGGSIPSLCLCHAHVPYKHKIDRIEPCIDASLMYAMHAHISQCTLVYMRCTLLVDALMPVVLQARGRELPCGGTILFVGRSVTGEVIKRHSGMDEEARKRSDKV
eukprot:2421532-Pleurochrysis_carterae.AAC.4